MASSRSRLRQALSALGLATVLVANAACGGSTEAAPHEPPANASLRPGDDIPAVQADVVLTVSGKLANERKSVPFDIATIEAVGVEAFTVYEPLEDANLVFRGVDLRDLLAVAGVADDATDLHMVALDDYVVALDLQAINGGGIMLATATADGSAIPVERGGPIRVVFKEHAQGAGQAHDWIWSLVAAEVR